MLLLLVDGFNLLYRLKGKENIPESYIEYLANISKKLSIHKILVCWEGENSTKKKRYLNNSYKSGKRAINHDIIEDPYAVLNKIKHILEILNIPQFEIPYCEADDVIARLVHLFDKKNEIIIFSNDGDFKQLIGDGVSLYSGKSTITRDSFREIHWGLLPENYLILKAITGDVSDNIKPLIYISKDRIIKELPVLKQYKISIEEFIKYIAEQQDTNKIAKKTYNKRERLLSNYFIMDLGADAITLRLSDNNKKMIDFILYNHSPCNLYGESIRHEFNMMGIFTQNGYEEFQNYFVWKAEKVIPLFMRLSKGAI